MDEIWRVRPYAKPAFAQPVPSDPMAQLRTADLAVLRTTADPGDTDIMVRVEVLDGARAQGTIARANQLGAGGDQRFVVGLRVLFEERH
ncbi:MAG: hypothetical protein ACYC3L_15620, partial [Gemmatimonadaceae bacterium]